MGLLADFILESDLCLPKDSAPVDMHDHVLNWVLILSNIEPELDATSAKPAARLAFDHNEEMATARQSANEKPAAALNVPYSRAGDGEAPTAQL